MLAGTELERAQAVAEFLSGYEGDFEFLVSLKDRVARGVALTPAQIAAAERCMRWQQRTREPADEGFYLEGDQVVRVRPSRSGGRYAQRLAIEWDERRNEQVARWVYVPGLVFRLGEARRLTEAEAAEWGLRFGFCAVCGRSLTAEGSVAAGIGPVCRRRLSESEPRR
jgi:hypothetical protein